MFDIAVMGDRDSICGFASLGMQVYPVRDAVQATDTLRQLARGSFAVIYMTEETAAMIPELVEKYREEPMPAIILIPGIKGNTGEGMANVSRSVEKAVGSDLIS